MLSKRKELHRLGRCVESILLVATEDCRGLCDGGPPLDASTSISEYLAGLRVVTGNTAVYLVTGTPVTSGTEDVLQLSNSRHHFAAEYCDTVKVLSVEP